MIPHSPTFIGSMALCSAPRQDTVSWLQLRESCHRLEGWHRGSAHSHGQFTFMNSTLLFIHKQLGCGTLKMTHSLRLIEDTIRTQELDSTQQGERWG